MGRILYGVQGDNFGHINRSLSVAELLKGHELLFVGGGLASKAQDIGYNFESLPVMGVAIRDNAFQLLPSIMHTARILATKRRWVLRLQEIITAFDPDLILTDYEWYTPRAAFGLGRPYVSLDHAHVVSRTVYPAPLSQCPNKYLEIMLMRQYFPGLQTCLMTSFHRPPLNHPEDDAIFGVLPRSDTNGVTPSKGEHTTVYLPGSNADKVRRLFHNRRRQYHIYGLGELPEQGNLKFFPISRASFLEDLAGSSYVVSCGGHGLLTEALLFGKPCLCFPRRFMYEQLWNCCFIQKNGYGRYYSSFDVPTRIVDDFEASLDTYTANISAEAASPDFNGKQRLADILNAMLQK